MYCDFYQMRERPFNVTADPKFLYLNARYREALASLHYGVTQRKGFVTLIGEAGTGKTTLLKKLLEDVDPSTRTVFVFNTNVAFDEILEYIFGEFDLPIHNGKRLYMLQRLNAFLLDELREGRNVALLIDEAQDLDYSVLEDLRLLSNLETSKEKILQIVLSGQPELGQKLANPSLRQLRQRVAVNCHLVPLTRDELSEYIESRLNAAGCADLKLFSRDAEERIFDISGGIPRLVNVVCDNALVIGYALGKKRIGADVIKEAAADLLPTLPYEQPEGQAKEAMPAAVVAAAGGRRMSQIGVVAVVVMAIVIGLLSVGRSLLRRDGDIFGRGEVARAPLQVINPGSAVQAQAERELQPVRPALSAVAPERAPEARELMPRAPEPRAPDPSYGRGAEQFPSAAHEPASRPSESAFAARAPRAPVYDTGIGDVADVGPAGLAVHGTGESAGEVELGDLQVAQLVEPANELPAETVQTRVGPLAMAVPEPPVRQPEVVAGPPSNAAPGARDPSARYGDELALAAVGDQLALETDRAPSANSLRLALSGHHLVKVRQDDSVSRIAIRHYGQASHTVLDLMKMANPAIRDIDVISVGQELQLPRLEEGLVLLREADGDYALLLLSTPYHAQAKQIRAALRRRGFNASIGEADFGGGQIVWRILIGGLPSKASAKTVGKELQQLFRDDRRIAVMAE